jgi:hypothetical protein
VNIIFPTNYLLSPFPKKFPISILCCTAKKGVSEIASAYYGQLLENGQASPGAPRGIMPTTGASGR